MTKSKKKDEFDFEKTVAELEALVEKMEKGDISLEESLKHFERGINLTRACQKALMEAEQKVEILSQKGGDEALAPHDVEPTTSEQINSTTD